MDENKKSFYYPEILYRSFYIPSGIATVSRAAVCDNKNTLDADIGSRPTVSRPEKCTYSTAIARTDVPALPVPQSGISPCGIPHRHPNKDQVANKVTPLTCEDQG